MDIQATEREYKNGPETYRYENSGDNQQIHQAGPGGRKIQYCDTGINEEGGDKGLKTEQSTRLVPLHPFIVELGFISFVKGRKAQGQERVFDLKKIRDWYSHYATKRFGEYLRKDFEITDKKKTFHSFRHLFIDYLKQNRFERSMCKQVVGHADDDMSFGHYGENYSLETLYTDMISKIDFGVDLIHLKESKYSVTHL